METDSRKCQDVLFAGTISKIINTFDYVLTQLIINNYLITFLVTTAPSTVVICTNNTSLDNPAEIVV